MLGALVRVGASCRAVALVFSLALSVALALALVPATGVTSAAAPPAETGYATYVVRLRDVDPSAGMARALVAGLGGEVTTTYQHVVKGFAARLPAGAADALRRDPRVMSVRRERVVHVSGEQGSPAWGLDRSDQRRLPLDRRYVFPADAGARAHVYVVDTGLNAGHREFAGRVGASRNFVPLLFFVDPDDWSDCEGHGTHVASIAVGSRWGVAKRATVHAVRALDCSGSAPTSWIIQALDWVAANHQSPAVANLSFGSVGADPDLEAAVRGLVRSGVSVVMAAGNEAVDACVTSPAREPAGLAVAATTQTDTRPSFSNTGPCVDLFAPGVGITGADLTPDGAVVMSGTSMAAPHVSGAVALLRSRRPDLSAAEAQSRVVAAATRDVVEQAGTGTPNRLLRVTGGDAPPVARFTARCGALRCVLDAARSSDDRRIAAYRWFVGHRHRASGERVVLRLGSRGSRSITLRVVDSAGQKAERTKTVDPR